MRRMIDLRGVMVYVDPDGDMVSRELMERGDWDAPLADIITEVAQPDWTFLDLGAHIGYFSLLAAPHYKRVVAVEPQPCDLLRASIKANGFTNIEVWEGAVATGPVRMEHNAVNRAASRLVPDENGTVARCELAFKEWPQVVKMDIEGMELEVLLAYPELMKQARVLIFEYQPNLSDGPQLIKTIADAGLRILHDNGELPTLETVPPTGWYANFVGLRGVTLSTEAKPAQPVRWALA